MFLENEEAPTISTLSKSSRFEKNGGVAYEGVHVRRNAAQLVLRKYAVGMLF